MIDAASAHSRLHYDSLRLLWGVRAGPQRWRTRWFAVQQRILGAGGGSAAEARAWYRRYEWAQTRRRLGLFRALLAIAKRPARVVRDAWTGIHPYGPSVRDVHGVPLWTQRWHLLWLALRHGLDSYSYYSLWLYRRERRRRAGCYVQWQEAGLLYRLLAAREALDDFLILDDKKRFATWCGDAGLPTPAIVATFEGHAHEGDAMPAFPDVDLFSKPVDLYGGQGARRWRRVAPSTWRGDDGVDRDAESLARVLRAQAESGRVIVQRALANHPDIAKLTTGALCTTRIMTIRAPGGEPEPLAALFRMATGGQSTDNISIAGIGANVDLDTGELGPGVRLDRELLFSEVLRHPDTGASIPGTRLPLWADAKALALAAHGRLPSIAVVGWDVALTPEGPVLIEANWGPAAHGIQTASGIPLGDTRFVECLRAHLRRSFGACDGTPVC